MSDFQDIFIKKFELPSDGFSAPIKLTDVEVGFSVYRDRRQEGFKSLFRIYIEDQKLKNETISLKPLIITAEYGKKSENGIIVSSSDFKRGINWPLNLVSEYEFFWDIKNNDFYKGKEIISGIDILRKVDKCHIQVSEPLHGFQLRIKILFFNFFLPFLIKIIFDSIAVLEYLISGERMHIFADLNASENSIKRTGGKPKGEPGQKIKIFEYEVEAWVAVMYCLINLIIYSIFYFNNFKPHFLKTIFENNFLTLMYGVISIGLVNSLLPRIFKNIKFIKKLLKIVQGWYLNFAYKKISIKI